MGFLQNILAFVFVLGVMILVHELGHFLAAKYFDVRVEAFAFGFGPRLFGFKRGETDFKVCLLPLGGFVKMAGENPEETSKDPRDFSNKPRWQRMVIAVMGPLFNFGLAIGILTGLFLLHYEKPAFLNEPALLGYVVSDSPAARAGIRAGDVVVAIDGQATPTWESVRLIEITAALLTTPVTIERDGQRMDLSLTFAADERTGTGTAGWSETTEVLLEKTLPDSPAEAAGVKAGDTLLAINGEPVRAVEQVPAVIQQLNGEAAKFQIKRDDETMVLVIRPEMSDAGGKDIWMIGVALKPNYRILKTKLGLVDALRESVHQNLNNATLIIRFLRGLVAQRMSAKSLEGPIGIARLSGEAARSGLPALFGLMAAISLNLGIFNLLPIPILDGGVITLLIVESVIRRDLSLVIKERIVQVGFLFLILLFTFVMYNDVVKSFSTG